MKKENTLKLLTIKLIRILIVTWLWSHEGFAQGTLQVVTKSIDKTFDRTSSIKIEAEKADIELNVWSGDKIKVSIDLTAKHPNRKDAQNDLEMMKYVAEKFGNVLVLRNYIQIENAKNKPVSNLKAKFVISVPEQMMVSIQNSFGKININGKFKQLQLKTDFCNTELKNVSGIIKLDSHYGEINAHDLSGKVELKSDRTEINLTKISEDFTIIGNFLKLFINSVSNLQRLKIEAQKSEISLEGIFIKNHHFHLVSEYGKLKVPPNFVSSHLKNKETATFNENIASTISISNSFGTISIEN